MHQITENGAGPRHFPYIKDGGKVLPVCFPQSAQMNENPRRSHRGPLGILQERFERVEAFVMDVVGHSSGECVNDPVRDQEFVPGFCQRFFYGTRFFCFDPGCPQTDILSKCGLFLFSNTGVFRFVIIYKVVNRSHETVGRACCLVTFPIPECSCNKDIGMVLDLLEIYRMEYFKQLLCFPVFIHWRNP